MPSSWAAYSTNCTPAARIMTRKAARRNTSSSATPGYRKANSNGSHQKPSAATGNPIHCRQSRKANHNPPANRPQRCGPNPSRRSQSHPGRPPVPCLKTRRPHLRRNRGQCRQDANHAALLPRYRRPEPAPPRPEDAGYNPETRSNWPRWRSFGSTRIINPETPAGNDADAIL